MSAAGGTAGASALERQRLGHAAARGVLWAFTATVAGRAVTLASLAVLARILVPEDFGLIAFALVLILYVDTVGDLGTGMALIHWPDRRADAAQLTFLANLGMGIVWLLLTYLLADSIASFFESETGASILKALAWSFPIRALGNTHDALLQKDLRFRARLVPELAQAAGKGIMAIALAVAGLGVWSLVWGQLAGLTLWTVCLWLVVSWRPAARLPVDLIRPMLRYGRGIVAVNVLAAIVHHSDLVIVGRMLGVAALGFYQMAYKIPEAVVTVGVRVASKVLFPAFSVIHATGARMRDAYLTALRYIALTMTPAAVGLALLAEPVVLTAFGEQWRPAIPLCRALAIYAGLRALGTHAGDVLKARGRPGLLASLGVLKAALLLPVLVVAGQTSATAVAVALATVTAFTMALDIVVVSRLESIRLAAVAGAIAPGIAGALVMGGVLVAWLHLAADLAPALALGGGVLIGGGTYLLVIARLTPGSLIRATASLRRERPTGPRPAAGLAESGVR